MGSSANLLRYVHHLPRPIASREEKARAGPCQLYWDFEFIVAPVIAYSFAEASKLTKAVIYRNVHRNGWEQIAKEHQGAGMVVVV